MRARRHPGRAPWKSPATLRVAGEVLAEPVVNGANWTLPRLRRVIAERTGVEISKSRLSVGRRKKGASSADARATRCAAARTRRRSSAPVPDLIRMLKQQAVARDIILLFEDESEALTHPYLA